MIARFFYHAGLTLFLLSRLPELLKGKYRRSFRQRFGRLSLKLSSPAGKRVWLHAVSVGEVRAAAPLAKKLYEELGCEVVVTAVTETGLAEAKRSLPFALDHLYLPFDYLGAMRRFAAHLKPDLLLFSETDFWPHAVAAAKGQGAKLAIVNGKLSERSFKRYRLLGHPFSSFERICCQTEEHAARFERLGVCRKRLFVTGNLKLEMEEVSPPELSLEAWRQGRPLIVLGSTHEGEEEPLLKALCSLEEVKLLLVPRHPERFGPLFRQLKDKGFSLVRYSELSEGDKESKILLLDAMGLLRSCYRLASLALVGGSFLPGVGGHNVIEPLLFGAPVLFGPYMESQKEFAALCLSYRAGIQLPLPEVERAVRALLSDERFYREMREKGQKLVSLERGALEKNLKVLTEFLEK